MLRPQKRLYPSDKVFAMLGLANQSLRAKLCLGYTLPPRGIYTTVALASVTETWSLGFLNYVYGHRDACNIRSASMKLPSFVPTLTAALKDASRNFRIGTRCRDLGCYSELEAVWQISPFLDYLKRL